MAATRPRSRSSGVGEGEGQAEPDPCALCLEPLPAALLLPASSLVRRRAAAAGSGSGLGADSGATDWRLPCGHRFHTWCLLAQITQWDARCSLCRQPFVGVVGAGRANANANANPGGEGGEGDDAPMPDAAGFLHDDPAAPPVLGFPGPVPGRAVVGGLCVLLLLVCAGALAPLSAWLRDDDGVRPGARVAKPTATATAATPAPLPLVSSAIAAGGHAVFLRYTLAEVTLRSACAVSFDDTWHEVRVYPKRGSGGGGRGGVAETCIVTVSVQRV